MPDDVVLKVENVSKAFGGVQALNKVNLTIRSGEIHCLAGGNGSGKSTLIKIISGYYKPDEGTISIGGSVYQRLTPIESIMEGVQVIYQDLSVFPNLTVAENIALNNELYNKKKFVNWQSVRKIASEAIDRIGIKLNLDENVESLPLADKQLVAIARAISNKAKLIIMDEPTAALTRREIATLFEIITKLKNSGVAILFVSHKLDEIFEIADNFTIFRNGENVITDNTANVASEKFVYYMTGRKLDEEKFVPKSIDKTKELFRVENLALENGFEDINFTVYAGEILGITGLLGSGRTELAKSLFGLYPPDKGDIYINGIKISITSPMSALGNKIGYVPEDRLTEGLCLVQSVEQNMAISSIDRLVKGRSVDRKKIREDMDYWKNELSIVMADPKDPINTLSGGNQQKVVLAKWLETQPRVLILNGPTVGVDVGAKFDLHNYLRELVSRGNVAVILISDDIAEVVNNCNRILIMKKGRIAREILNTETNEHELLVSITTNA